VKLPFDILCGRIGSGGRSRPESRRSASPRAGGRNRRGSGGAGEVSALLSPLSLSPYLRFRRDEWAPLRADTPSPSPTPTSSGSALVERLSLLEVEEIYLPLSRLLNLYVAAVQGLYRATSTFLGHGEDKVPFLIGLGGSVAVGKSTAARALRELLARWPHHPRVDIVTTDGFLHPPPSWRSAASCGARASRRATTCARSSASSATSKRGKTAYEPRVLAPRLRRRARRADRDRAADIVIVEGLNVLQTGPRWTASPASSCRTSSTSRSTWTRRSSTSGGGTSSVSSRCATPLQGPLVYFHRYASLSDEDAADTAGRIWAEINEPNLRQNILPTRERADLILRKGRTTRSRK